jgi:hypothetical protein
MVLYRDGDLPMVMGTPMVLYRDGDLPIVLYTACFSTFATRLGHSKPQFILELLFRHFDGVVE